MGKQGVMIDDDAPEMNAPTIVFTMPSLRGDAEVVTEATDDTELFELRVVEKALVQLPTDSDIAPPPPPPPPPSTHLAPAPAAVLPDGTFGPPTADMRAEYMYSLVEAERARILAAAEPEVGLRERLRRRRK